MWDMNPHGCFRNIASSACALALLCVAMDAPAQTIYKQVDAAGRVTFTDRPDPSLPAQSMAAPVPNAVPEPPTPAARTGLLTARRLASIDANEAARRLTQAQLKRSEGADLLPGDWTHGSTESVTNQRYSQRQDKLRVLVEKAQQRSDETRLALLARS